MRISLQFEWECLNHWSELSMNGKLGLIFVGMRWSELPIDSENCERANFRKLFNELGNRIFAQSSAHKLLNVSLIFSHSTFGKSIFILLRLLTAENETNFPATWNDSQQHVQCLYIELNPFECAQCLELDYVFLHNFHSLENKAHSSMIRSRLPRAKRNSFFESRVAFSPSLSSGMPMEMENGFDSETAWIQVLIYFHRSTPKSQRVKI